MENRYKFRAWDSKNKILYHQNHLHSFKFEKNNVWYCIQSGNDVFLCSYFDSFLMQYTGLKDKNGKEIYEGDIVRNIYPSPYNVDETYVVKCNIACGWSFGPYGNIAQAIGYYNSEPEVIGNIYENPELMKGE